MTEASSIPRATARLHKASPTTIIKIDREMKAPPEPVAA